MNPQSLVDFAPTLRLLLLAAVLALLPLAWVWVRQPDGRTDGRTNGRR